MKRSYFNRKTPLAHKNAKRKKKLLDIQFGSHADSIRTLGCLVCNDRPVEPHHYPTRGAGGTAWGVGFCLGNVLKYVCRAGRKGDRLQDLRKARWYLDREILTLEGTDADTSG